MPKKSLSDVAPEAKKGSTKRRRTKNPLSKVDRCHQILGQRIRSGRVHCHMTQVKLAQLAKIDRSYLGRIERGSVSATFAMLIKLAEHLGWDVGTLTRNLPGQTWKQFSSRERRNLFDEELRSRRRVGST